MIQNCDDVLVLAPHTEDGKLGLGGAMNRWVIEGKNVTYIAFSTMGEFVSEGYSKDIKNITVLRYELAWNNHSFDTSCFV